MSRRRPRGLSEEDRALWRKVAESTVPMRAEPTSPKPQTPATPPAPRPPAKQPTVSKGTEHRPLAPFRIGEKATGQHRGPTAEPPPAMDHRLHRKLKGGKLSPESRLDLHGYTLAQAQPRLTQFILDNAEDGRRLVLVITGKGRGDDGPLPVRSGALRHAVPHWLHSLPLKSVVLQVTQAHQRHGGEGALYVYLRRRR